MGDKENLERIANALEEFVKVQKDLYENPQQFMERAREGLESLAEPRVIEAEATREERQELPEGVKAQYQIELTDEEKQKIVKDTMEAIEPQFERMREFVSSALKDLPDDKLKKIGEHIEKREIPKFRRRAGCVHLDFGYGDEEFYLRL